MPIADCRLPILLNRTIQVEGAALHALARELYPVCRSITGDGVRRSLRRLQELIPLELHEVPTGTTVFDWTVPNEWNIDDAWIKNAHGERLVDFQQHCLHVVNYSVPVHARLTWAALQPHLFTRPDRPQWIPYRTSYYKETWGFCLAHSHREQLAQADARSGGTDQYEVGIDSRLGPGFLTYGEFFKRGDTDDEFLFSCHSCHPALANDNLSGMVVLARLAQELAKLRTRFSYRFLWVPGTIGAITWLAINEASLGRVRLGLVLSCVGDPGPFTYKQSRRGDAVIDRLVEKVLATACVSYRVRSFSPLGYDERQYCSPGINLPMGCFMRTPHGEFPEYHTSADNLDLITPAAMAESLDVLCQIVRAAEELPPSSSAPGTLEAPAGSRAQDEASSDGSTGGDVGGVSVDGERRYLNRFPKGEPQLGRRGLYRSMGGTVNPRAEEALLWVLNYSDGHWSLAQIADKAALPLSEILGAATRLAAEQLIEPIG